MNFPDDHQLEDRLTRLEQRLSKLESLLLTNLPNVSASASSPESIQDPLPKTTLERLETPALSKNDDLQSNELSADTTIWRSEYWLHLTGIILLLFAVAFLFKYAIDQGWLTPAVRVVIGLLVGSGLLIGGWRLSERPRFKAMLLGGGIGAYYITGFATFQLYHLLPYSIVFGFMIFNTILAFILAVRGNYLILSLLAITGGLATPFVLSTNEGSVITLMIYTLLLLIGAAAIYLYLGWQPLLWLANLGGWLVIALGVGQVAWAEKMSLADAWIVQIVLIGWWLLFWLGPLGRPALVKKWPSLPRENLGWVTLEKLFEHLPWSNLAVYSLALVTPLTVVGFTALIWADTLGDEIGWVALGLAVANGVIVYWLWDQTAHYIGHFHLGVAVLLSTIGLSLLLERNSLLLALLVQVLLLQLLARYQRRQFVFVIADIVATLPALVMLGRLWNDPITVRTAEIYVNSSVDLLVIATAAAMAWKLCSMESRPAYALLAHIGLLLWFWRELAGLDDGQAFVSIAWGIYAVALLVTGLRFDQVRIRTTALITLAVLVGKLFLIDLAFVNPLGRILLFFAFGGLFLALSSLVMQKWRPANRRE